MYCDAEICRMKDGRMEIHDASDLRQSLSDELHARAFMILRVRAVSSDFPNLLAMMTAPR